MPQVPIDWNFGALKACQRRDVETEFQLLTSIFDFRLYLARARARARASTGRASPGASGRGPLARFTFGPKGGALVYRRAFGFVYFDKDVLILIISRV